MTTWAIVWGVVTGNMISGVLMFVAGFAHGAYREAKARRVAQQDHDRYVLGDRSAPPPPVDRRDPITMLAVAMRRRVAIQKLADCLGAPPTEQVFDVLDLMTIEKLAADGQLPKKVEAVSDAEVEKIEQLCYRLGSTP